MSRVVVVGAGMAAVRLAEQLVARGHTGTTTLVGEEEHAPYNRILLSAVLEGTHRPEALALRDPAWYARHGVDLRLGTRVLEVDRAAGEVVLVDGSRLGFDHLVLATGAIPTLPPVRGLVRVDGRLDDRVHAFRGLADCRRLDAAVRALLARPATAGSTRSTGSTEPPEPPRAVVVGGGLLGLQVARALAVRGLAVEVVEGGDHLLRSHVGAAAGRILARDLRRLGTAVYTGTRATRLTPDGLRLDTGHTLSTDLVVLTAGGRPSTALARAAGLTTRRGVVVGPDLTSPDDSRVHALGDCAELRTPDLDPAAPGRTTGFVPPAWEQAGVLAARLTGAGTGTGAADPGEGGPTYDGSRVVARLRATDLDVAVLGDPEAEEAAGGEVVEVANPLAGSHRRLVVRDGRVVAGTLVGDLSRIGLITQAYDRGTVLGPHEPGALVLVERPTRAPGTSPAAALPDDAEVCACAGVSAGAVRAQPSLEAVRDTTRATTGCGGCAPLVRQLLACRTTPTSPAPPQTEGTLR